MTAYVDASVLIRLAFGAPGMLSEWPRLERIVGSELVETECLRTFDRYRQAGAAPALELAARRAMIEGILGNMEMVPLNRRVLRRAAEPMPAPLGTLDAIHLVSALLWQESYGRCVMATHDLQLAYAARAFGMGVVGAA